MTQTAKQKVKTVTTEVTETTTPTVDSIIENATVAATSSNLPATIDTNRELIVETPQYKFLMDAFENSDTNSILLYESSAQSASTSAAEVLLEGVRNKDLGPIGKDLNTIALSIKGFDLSALKGDQKEPGFIGKLLGKVSPVAQWLESYSTVEGQIEAVMSKLSDDQMKLMEDVEKLDRMFRAQVEQMDRLEDAIEAAEYVLQEVNEVILPKLQHAATNSGDTMAGTTFADKKDMRDKIERRLHDLRLTKEIVRQNLPGIRTTQQSDANLVSKIESIKVNTIPLWKQQMAILVAAVRTKGIAQSVNEITDITNDLLRSGADLVKDANVEARKALERGIVSVDTILYVNTQMIEMIEETTAIYEDAKTQRAEAVQRMDAAASALKKVQLLM